MALTKVGKSEVIKKFEQKKDDTGSPSVQIALMTERINQLIEHFKDHKKDHGSRRGLLRLVGQRRRMLNYVKKRDQNTYKELLVKLKLRK